MMGENLYLGSTAGLLLVFFFNFFFSSLKGFSSFFLRDVLASFWDTILGARVRLTSEVVEAKVISPMSEMLITL